MIGDRMSEERGKLIKVIHVARRELAMDDDSYRQMLAAMPGLDGQTSTAKLSVPKLKMVLEMLKSKGFKVRPNRKTQGKPHNFYSNAMPLMITKIEAQLADMKLSWSYADGIARQMFGIQKCAWIREPEQLQALIAALDVEQGKRSLLAEVETSFQERGMDMEAFEKQNTLAKNWKRNRRILKNVLNQYPSKYMLINGVVL
jgi:phage gp16-like protein